MRIKQGDVTYTIEAMPDDTEIRGNASACGDAVEDKRIEDWIIEQLENGNEWAWCTVKVTAELNGFEGCDYLGSCSYSNKEQFVLAGDYLPDMKARALEDLIQNIEDAAKRLKDSEAS